MYMYVCHVTLWGQSTWQAMFKVWGQGKHKLIIHGMYWAVTLGTG